MEDNNVIYQKSYNFANDIVKCYKTLLQIREYNLANQMERSGTAVGALIREAHFAQSRADFVSKLQIALKEANETQYWLNLLFDNEYIERGVYDNLIAQAKEITAILVSIIKTTKNNSK